jgi:hypothetical protein
MHYIQLYDYIWMIKIVQNTLKMIILVSQYVLFIKGYKKPDSVNPLMM